MTLRNLPRVDDLLASVKNFPEATGLPTKVLLAAVQDAIGQARTALLAKAAPSPTILSPQHIIHQALANYRPHPAVVINATGIPLHTNLGRAPMAQEVAEAIKQTALHYSTLEFDQTTGRRGSRTAPIEATLTKLTGAEAACIVNNNAAAVLLTLSATCPGQEVVVSRGELVEIGGSFRIPEVIAQGGAVLKEVGATNKTHPKDYVAAINQNTAALLKVHTSNYQVQGFTKAVGLTELAALAHQHGLLSIYDIGSGSLVALGGEPTIQDAVAAGIDLTCFSGDKLLGGPQCGVIVGKKQHIQKLTSHPLYRALRADKLTLAALSATLNMYQDPAYATAHIPILHMLTATPDALKQKAQHLLGLLNTTATITPTTGEAGGGSLPCVNFNSWAVALPTSLEGKLRGWHTPIIPRIYQDQLLLDVRTIFPHQLEIIAECINF